MTTYLGNLAVAGQIGSLQKNSVRGWLKLSDRQRPLVLVLNGNVAPELAGQEICFFSLDFADWLRYDIPPVPCAIPTLDLAACQIGPLLEFDLHDQQPPETDDALGLASVRLEWSGQDGQVIVDLPEVWFEQTRCDELGEGGDGESESMLADRRDKPDGISSEWDRQAVERAMIGQWNATMGQRLMSLEELFRGGSSVPIGALLDPPIRLMAVDELDDQTADVACNEILARLAPLCVGVDICPHFDARQTYAFLVVSVLTQPVYPELQANGCIRRFSTSQVCDECFRSQ